MHAILLHALRNLGKERKTHMFAYWFSALYKLLVMPLLRRLAHLRVKLTMLARPLSERLVL